MAISLGSLKRLKANASPIALFYGVPGVGKTLLASELPKTVWVQFDGESAPAGVSLDGWDGLTDYSDADDAIRELYENEHEFKTLVIDSTSGLEAAINREACRRNKWETLEDPGYGKGYVAAENVWMEFFEKLAMLRRDTGMAIILLGHTEINRFDSPTTDPYSRYRVGLHKRAAALVEEHCDLIGFLNYRTTLKKVDTGFNKSVTHGEGGGQRVIYLEERPGFIAKNRFNMPSEITFKKGEGYTALAKHFPAAE